MLITAMQGGVGEEGERAVGEERAGTGAEGKEGG